MKTKKLINVLSFITFFILTACSGSGPGKGDSGAADNDPENELRLKQYVVQGKKLYQMYCINCHQDSGKGLAQLYPPLSGSDYLLENLPRAACIIKNGLTEEITVNGTTFNQMMPGNPGLSPLEVAEILTYITNSWENNKGLSSVKKVEKWVAKCNE